MLLDTRSRSPPALSLSPSVSLRWAVCVRDQKPPEKNHLISIYDIKCGRIVLYFMQTSTLSTPHRLVLWLCFCHHLSSTSSTQKFQSSNLLWFIILTVHVSKPFFHTYTHTHSLRLSPTPQSLVSNVKICVCCPITRKSFFTPKHARIHTKTSGME